MRTRESLLALRVVARSTVPATRATRSAVWATTSQLAEEIGVSTRTIKRLIARGFFKRQVHWRPANPYALRSTCLWHRKRVAALLWSTAVEDES